jgi:spore germination protein KA
MSFFKSILPKKASTPVQHVKKEGAGRRNPLEETLEENINKIKSTLGHSEDIILRRMKLGKEQTIDMALLYTDGLSDIQSIQDFILEPLLLDVRGTEWEKKIVTGEDPLDILQDFILSAGDLQRIADYDELFNTLLSGHAILLLDGCSQGFSIGLTAWEDRGVTEPSAQTVIRGPREGFSETLRTNTALIRRKIKDQHLWLENKQIGRRTKTAVSIMYIKGVANDKIVQEVHARLDRIDIDGILESGNIEELIQDEPYSPWPTVYNTERPDVAAAGLLEGRIAILVDGTPFVLLVPALFVQYFQAAEDYYHRSDFGLIRMLRYLSFFIALLAPSLYIAITTYHQEMLPTPLLISLAAQREGVPFPAFVEALMMEVAFEILREAGVRMPRAVGQAISIVGALVIGQAAVEAGIVSAAMVIVVSITAISNFVLPSFNIAIAVRMLRFALMGLAAAFGLFGILVALIAMLLHLSSIRSFGVPYMSPFAPFVMSEQTDTIFRMPIWKGRLRPRYLSKGDDVKANNKQPSKPDR